MTERKALGILAAVLVALGALPQLILNGVLLLGRGPWVTVGSELLILPGLLALVVIIVAVPFLAFARTRHGGTYVIVWSIALFLGTILGTIGGGVLRMKAFHMAAERAEPLVAAISRFELDKGHPPSSFGDLVPQYLPAMPARLPPLELVSGESARADYHGNSWILRADVGIGILNWDQFLFFPKQNYPPHGYGGSLERVGRWAYVHE